MSYFDAQAAKTQLRRAEAQLERERQERSFEDALDGARAAA